MQNEDWDIYRYVIALADMGTASAAAARLGVNHTTVLRRVSQYEEKIGVKLFTRSRAGYAPTVEGEAVIGIARKIATDIANMQREVLGGDAMLDGTLSVTTTESFAPLLMPHFRAFRQAHPSICVDLAVTNERLNLFDRDADIGIRPARECPPNLVGVRVCGLALARYGPANGEVDDLILPGDSLNRAPIPNEFSAQAAPSRVAMRCNSFPAMREAVAAGLGAGLLPCVIGDVDARLRRIEDPVPDSYTAMWILTHPDLQASLRVRSFIDFMAERLARDAPLLEGRAG